MAFFIRPMLSKHTAQINLASLGGAIGLLALAPRQFLAPHGHARAVGAGIQNGRVAPTWLGLPLLPSLRIVAHPLHHTLNLAGGHLDGTGFGQVSFHEGKNQGHYPAKAGV